MNRLKRRRAQTSDAERNSSVLGDMCRLRTGALCDLKYLRNLLSYSDKYRRAWSLPCSPQFPNTNLFVDCLSFSKMAHWDQQTEPLPSAKCFYQTAREWFERNCKNDVYQAKNACCTQSSFHLHYKDFSHPTDLAKHKCYSSQSKCGFNPSQKVCALWKYGTPFPIHMPLHSDGKFGSCSMTCNSSLVLCMYSVCNQALHTLRAWRGTPSETKAICPFGRCFRLNNTVHGPSRQTWAEK